MRNVVTLSDIPKDLHDWLKTEAAHRTKILGKRVGISQLVVQAISEYKEKVAQPSRKRRLVIPTMQLFRKKIQPSELKRGCICVPRSRWHYFGTVGNTIAMKDAMDGSTYLVSVGSQYRLGMRNWFNRYNKVKPGDEIIFEQTDGTITIKTLAI